MATANKTCSLGRRIYRFAASVSGVIALLIILWGCTANDFNAGAITWKTYSNSRYGFEFPYPSNWTSLASENGDGIALISPQENSVEIRGWASHQLPNDPESMKKIKSNKAESFNQIILGVIGTPKEYIVFTKQIYIFLCV